MTLESEAKQHRFDRWQPRIRSRVSDRNSGRKATLLGEPFGIPPRVRLIWDLPPVTEPGVKFVPDSEEIVLTDKIEPLWPPERGRLVEDVETGEWGEVLDVLDYGGGNVEFTIRLDPETDNSSRAMESLWGEKPQKRTKKIRLDRLVLLT